MEAAEKEKPPRAGTQGGLENNNNGEAKDSTPTTCKEVARAVVGNGYLTIPIKPGDKRPAIDSWQHARLTAAEELVQRFPAHGVGILTGQGDCPLVAVDIDSTDEGLAAEAEAWCLDHFGRAPVRVGRAPKALLVYLAAEPGWPKQQSVKFNHPSDQPDAKGKRPGHQLEILGAGQQFVAFGVHPKTNEPYRWGDASDRLLGFGTVDDPTTVRAADLPIVTRAQLAALLEAFQRMAEARGLCVEGGRPKERAEASLGMGSTNPFLDEMMQSRPVGKSLAEARDLLTRLPRESVADYGQWLRAGMALHHEFSGSPDALALWDQWSAQAPNYVDLEDLSKRWDGFGKTGRAPLTLRSLLKLAGSQEPATAHGERFSLVHASEYARRPPPRWTVQGVVPEKSIGMVFGPSGSGKSFFVLDLVAAIARGARWCGLDTVQGTVVYVCAEGRGGFPKRLRAYEQANEISLDDVPLHVIGDTPSFRNDNDPDAICDAILEADLGHVAVVVIDTLAQVSAGANENAAEDMGPIIQRGMEIQERTGATVLLVHHTGKNVLYGARGWSGIKAAMDFEIEIVPPPKNQPEEVTVAEITKQKDGESGRAFGFKLRKVVLGGADMPDGESSCVVDHTDVPTQPKPVRGATQKAVLEVLFSGGATVDEIISKVVLTMKAPDEGKEDKRVANIRRSIKALVENGLISERGGKLTMGGPNLQKSADDDDRSSIRTDQDRS